MKTGSPPSSGSSGRKPATPRTCGKSSATSAYSDEFITMYLARGLRKGDQHLDADEFLDVYTVPLKDLVEDCMAGRISDAKTQVCILKAARILGI